VRFMIIDSTDMTRDSAWTEELGHNLRE